jgi:microcystin-dependent protein
MKRNLKERRKKLKVLQLAEEIYMGDYQLQAKSNRAITLISLVTTIIILIILASVSINVILGDNGLISKTKYAKDLYENAGENEASSLNEIYSQLLVASDGTISNISLETLESIINAKVDERLQGATAVPAGTVISYIVGNEAPSGYLKCDGTVYNISDYQTLADAIKNGLGSYNYYGGNGETTFAVPDLRGEFLRGTGTAKRNTGSGASVGAHQNGTRVAYTRGDGNYVWFSYNGIPSVFDTVSNASGTSLWRASSYSKTGTGTYPSTYTTRPTNTSVLYCIKY